MDHGEANEWPREAKWVFLMKYTASVERSPVLLVRVDGLVVIFYMVFQAVEQAPTDHHRLQHRQAAPTSQRSLHNAPIFRF